MRVLIVAATRPEVAPLIAAIANPVEHHRVTSGAIGPHHVDTLLTGVGMVATAVWCSRALAIGGYDLALNLGVSATGNACTSVNAGSGFSSAASTTATPWLQHNWSGTVGNPAARASFGVFKSPIIYGRENY